MLKLLAQLMNPADDEGTAGGEAAAATGVDASTDGAAPEVKGTALDAINEALGHTEGTPNEDADTDATAEDADAEDTVEVDAADAAAEAAKAKLEGRTADGKFDKGNAAAKKAEADAKAAAAKEPDAVNDPIPKDLAPKTQERMRKLVETAKDLTVKNTEAQQNFDFLVQGVQSTGASPEQYGETLSWLKLFNSNDAGQQAKALELVESVAERLATMLGKERTVGDPLAGHPDLKEAVQTGKTTLQYAKEIAITRRRDGFNTEARTAQSNQEQQHQQYEQAKTAARGELDRLETQLKASDPHYAAKRAQLVPMLQQVFPNIPYNQWTSAFKGAYEKMQFSPPAARAGVPANQPMRANKGVPTGGQTRAPSSGLEAINAALAGMK